MINVIPQVSNHRKIGFTPKSNNLISQSKPLAPLNADTVSFTGVKEIEFAKICGKFEPADLYLTQSKVERMLEKADPKKYMHILSEEVGTIVAKRLGNSNIMPNAELGSFGHPPYSLNNPSSAFKNEEPSLFNFHPKKNYTQRAKMDWTEQYRSLENIFEETGKKKPMAATTYDFKSAKNQIFAELRKLGLMQEL